jgi:hypothetical protein
MKKLQLYKEKIIILKTLLIILMAKEPLDGVIVNGAGFVSLKVVIQAQIAMGKEVVDFLE